MKPPIHMFGPPEIPSAAMGLPNWFESNSDHARTFEQMALANHQIQIETGR